MSGGVLVKGTGWGRGQDTFGLAIARNGLSSPHQDYLSAGGLGFFVGDGHLNYRPEAVTELYYDAKIAPGTNIAANYQLAVNPGYNADRGPVHLFALRLRTAF